MQHQQGNTLITLNNRLESPLAHHASGMADVTNTLNNLQLQMDERIAQQAQKDEEKEAAAERPKSSASAATWKASQAAEAFAAARRRRAEEDEVEMVEEDEEEEPRRRRTSEARPTAPPRKQPQIIEEAKPIKQTKGVGSTGRGGAKRPQKETRNVYEMTAPEEDPMVLNDAWMELPPESPAEEQGQRVGEGHATSYGGCGAWI